MYDRAAVMRGAHKRYRDGKRLGLGWSWSQCLSTAWAAEKMRRSGAVARMAA
ncbi:hypothetical protein LG047_02450 [Methylocystis sp. WRRC1]|uniref:hypothetical protein n=1 Tax=Methylocystis sp. WRRC1 TaxID=1732014 RepID=UPI001D13BF5F|nr:hypothetical protein [Methylocystis sp. WRRC1]MCC3244192.1 hypothetical protein [Methylocystis sp. WRRC1]